ncbi:hypothetical protein HYU07_02255 [Candidatus Woesearchaeota archaeon]|nr:hypothetical protein [Candidatus Woesearchaeota archaeon]
MSIRDLKGKVDDLIPVQNVLISVYDKNGLEELIPGLLKINPHVEFISTGGTYTKIKEILGRSATYSLKEVADYTGFPEMKGGLVKTLHPKIHAGILGERNNPEHQRYLNEDLNGAVYIDMVVVNLYPFKEMIKKIEAGEINKQTGKPYNFESARGNIDIGGPTMIRAAAKNFPGCAVVCDSRDYDNVLKTVGNNNGCTLFTQRLILAEKAFNQTSDYENAISKYFFEKTGSGDDIMKIAKEYGIEM